MKCLSPLMIALFAVALAGCFVHTYTATYPNAGCQTASAANSFISAANTSCTGSNPAPAASPTP